MGFSASHIILVAVGIFLLFGAGRLPKLMEDLAKGMKAFKKGMREEETLLSDASNSTTPHSEDQRKS